MKTMREQWGHVINPTPGQQRRAALRLIELAIAAGADAGELRDALEAIGVAPYEAKPMTRNH